MIANNITGRVEGILRLADIWAQDHPDNVREYIGSGHLLMALLQQESGPSYEIIKRCGLHPENFYEIAAEKAKEYFDAEVL